MKKPRTAIRFLNKRALKTFFLDFLRVQQSFMKSTGGCTIQGELQIKCQFLQNNSNKTESKKYILESSRNISEALKDIDEMFCLFHLTNLVFSFQFQVLIVSNRARPVAQKRSILYKDVIDCMLKQISTRIEPRPILDIVDPELKNSYFIMRKPLAEEKRQELYNRIKKNLKTK